jgi:hypothetical protein
MFIAISSQVRTLAGKALRALERHPSLAQSCLVNDDYAFRNILIDPDSYQVRAFIDWDDVNVMPFVIGVDFPEDIKSFSEEGLDQGSDYFCKGDFFPPDEYSEIVGAMDKAGKLTGIGQDGNSTGVDE